jgi:hemerythrin
LPSVAAQDHPSAADNKIDVAISRMGYMALMTWNDTFSVGVKEMDDQHKVLVNSLNDLHTAMIAGKAKQVTGELLTKLLEYTRSHFAAEEKFLSSSSYPTFAQHHAIHVNLTQQVEKYVERFQSGELMISVHLLNFLRDWLTNHIQKEDRNYGPWLNQRGIH